MAEPVLDQPRVMAGIGQGVAAGVAKHMSMDERKRPAALSFKDESTRRIALQFAQHAQFIASDGVDCGLAVLRPADVQRRIAAPFNLRPLEIGDLNSPQTVPESNQDQRSVPVAVAPQLGGGDQLLDLGRGQVFAGAHLSVWLSCRYFLINVVWLDQPQVRHHQHFPLHPDSNLPDNAPSSESRTGCRYRASQPVAAEARRFPPTDWIAGR